MATSDDPGTVESEASHPLRKTCDDHIGFRVYDHPTNQTTHTSPYAPHMGYYLPIHLPYIYIQYGFYVGKKGIPFIMAPIMGSVSIIPNV